MDTLTQALINAQKPRENAWQTAGQGMSQDTMSYLTNDNTFGGDSANSRLVASLISGLGGAALQGFGAYQERERRNQLNQDLMSLGGAYYGGEDINPLVDSLQSSEAKDLVPLLNIERASTKRAQDLEIAKERAKRQTDFQYDMMGKGLVMGKDETGGLQFTPAPGYIDTTAEMEGQKTLATELAKAKAQQSIGAPPKEIAEREDKFRTELFQRSGVDELRTVDQAFNSMIKSYGDNSGASDQDFIYGVAKTLDPTSVVRDGEQMRMTRTDGVYGEINNMLGYVQGGQKLSPETRKGLLQVAANRRDQLVNTYTGAVNEYKGLTDRAGGNFANVGIYGEYQPSNILLEALNKPAQASGSPSPSPVVGEKILILEDENGKQFKIRESEKAQYGL